MARLLFTLIAFALLHGTSIYAQGKRKTTGKRTTAVVVKLPNDTAMANRAKTGDAMAQVFVGRCYYEGEGGVEENDTEAFKWFRKAALNGSPYGLYYVALCYSNGFGVAKNAQKANAYFDKAIRQIEALAEKGDAEAQFYMGEIHQYGIRTGKEDYETAIEWYEKAAEQGHGEASCEAAYCCKMLYGSNSRGAFRWYKSAAEQGYPEGEFEFAYYYENGIGVEKSEIEATKLYLSSAKGGYGLGQFRIAECYELGHGIEKDIKEAVSWYKTAADNNVSAALYKLGCFYRDGFGVDRNYDLALKYLRRAAKDNKEASLDLKDMQAKGRNFYQKMPKRCPNDFYDLKPDDPFASLVLSDNWDELSEEMKYRYRQQFKKEKIRDWGVDKATKVAQHLVEIGFTSEQIQYSQGFCGQLRFINAPRGKVKIMEYPHCTYFLLNDKLFGMVWSNGVQVGDVKLIRTYQGNAVITEGNK